MNETVVALIEALRTAIRVDGQTDLALRVVDALEAVLEAETVVQRSRFLGRSEADDE